MNPPLLAFYQGEYLPLDGLKIEASDLIVQRGYGAFDFLKSIGGKPLFLDRYLERFANSAAAMRLQMPYSKDEIRQAIFGLMERNQIPDSGIKLILTGGPSADAYTPGKSVLFISQQPLTLPGPKAVEQGVSIITHEYARDLPEVKSINYLMGVWLQAKVEAAGAVDVLYQRGGVLSEFPRCNVFVVRQDGTLATPASGVLKGITRGNVLEIARRRGIATDVGTVTVDDLLGGAEAFLTSTTKRIIPIVKVDGKPIADGRPGALSKSLLADLYELEKA